MSGIVLCITHSGDFYTIDNVMAALAQRGYDPVRIDSDRFPMELRISGRPETGATFVTGDRSFEAGEVVGLWRRKVFMPKFDDGLDAQFVEGCIRESAAAFSGLLGTFRHLPSVNPFGSDRRGEDKLWQLAEARKAGLTVPRTLIGNDPEQVRAFYKTCGGKVVTKMLTPLTISMGRPSAFVYTSEITEEDLTELDGLRYSPMIFQEKIEKDVELRVAYVDGKVFTGTIDASESQKGQTDWRRSESGANQWAAGSVTEELRAKMQTMMEAMGLIFGAFDFIRTPEGEHVFLEVNPAGEWGMLEKYLDLPIADAIAEALHVRIRQASLS
ncbi:MAG: MvdC family ATP-grasp ribosomal peptide maturase [Acidobacteriota bacterium]|nr:MvdC family ATP-grasp ribosomal peptide maturase [Acidobacteriota bacterium]